MTRFRSALLRGTAFALVLTTGLVAIPLAAQAANGGNGGAAGNGDAGGSGDQPRRRRQPNL